MSKETWVAFTYDGHEIRVSDCGFVICEPMRVHIDALNGAELREAAQAAMEFAKVLATLR